MSKKVKVLTVCGSGTVSSTMIGVKIKDLLLEHDIDCEISEANPGMIPNIINNHKIDLIAYTSGEIDPSETNDIPVLNAVGVLTGLDEEAFIQQALAIFAD